MVRPRINPGWATCQGSAAYTFTDENSRGAGISLVQRTAPFILTLKVVEEPVLSWDTTMLDHWPNGGEDLMYVLAFGIDTSRPGMPGWYMMAGVLYPATPPLGGDAMCRMFVQPRWS